MNTSDFAQRLADKLIAQLQEGTAPWQKPWIEGQSFSPYNPTTGNRYRGVNILALISTEEINKKTDLNIKLQSLPDDAKFFFKTPRLHRAAEGNKHPGRCA